MENPKLRHTKWGTTHLSDAETQLWLRSMTMAGDYLVETMSLEFASINYVATTSATLMVLNEIIPDKKYTK